MVGRGRELALVRSWLAAETGGLVLCGGEPGIGKTRLAQELAGHALALGREVVWGHCVETEGAPAFWPWRQVLKAAGAGPDDVLAHDADVPQDRFRVFDASATALDRDGLVIIVEDVHWADQASLLALAHLATQLRTVLIFATFRDPRPAVADLMRFAVRIDLHAARYACQTDEEFRVIAVWQSKEHADRFFREVLGPVLARVLGPEPAGAHSVTGMEVLREFIPANAG